MVVSGWTKADYLKLRLKEAELSSQREAWNGRSLGWFTHRRREARTMHRLGKGQISLLLVLVTLLIITGVWAVSVWNATSGVEMGKHRWIAIVFGTFFSLLIGCGLMALMFFSSRRGYDDAADPFRKRDPPAK
jgi:hypothetical protein